MNTFVADISKKKNASPYLYGLFFEDINHAMDGGLNADLIQNGSFSFCYFNYSSIEVQRVYDNLRFWFCEPQKYFSITDEKPLHENKPFSLKLELKNDDGDAIIKNFGYEIYENQNWMYLPTNKFSCSFNFCSNANFEVECFFEYENGTRSKGETFELKPNKTYKKQTLSLSGRKGSYAHLVFVVKGKGKIYFSNFSLIPANYFKSTKNSYKYAKLNASLVKSLDMGAKFLRFPGGCLVEGDISTDHLFEWEKTIGPAEARGHKPSVWNYLQSNEVGFFEYLCLCEDLKLAPVPVHHVGLICQIRTEVFRHQGYIAYEPESAIFKEKVVDSVAHLIYFAKGSTTSKDKTEREWANKRKEMGHQRPFKLSMIALGNENWDKIYFRNFEACYQALKSYKYCGKSTDILKLFGIQILSSSGVDINPQDTNPSWKYITKNHQELIVDEHVYNTPEWFIDNFYRYDYYNPNTSKVFMGEYACHTQADGKGLLGGKNTFKSALAEAVFMCGMENNPDIVKMSCYAPLFCKRSQANWDPDLIYFDKDEVFFTPNYHTQALFMQNYGKYAIKLDTERNTKNTGQFVLKTNKNQLREIRFAKLDGQEVDVELNEEHESLKELENFCVSACFKEVKDNFGFVFGKKEGFGFYINYNFTDKHLYYEKLVNGKRMTLEDLGKTEFDKGIKIVFTNEEIAIYKLDDGKEKEVARKHIWKTNTKVFTSMTYDDKKVYVKVININKVEEAVNIVLPEALIKKVNGKLTTLTADANDELKCQKTQEEIKSTNLTLKPYSINVLTLKR